MQYLLITAVVFFVLLGMPFLNAVICCKKKGNVLYINQEYVKEARYFGKSFAQMVENSMASVENGNIFLSKIEKIIDVNEEELSEKAKKMVLCLKKDFKTPSRTKIFEKEIYGEKNVEIADGGVTVRAVYSKENLILGNQTSVVRWADAKETAAVYDDCSLGVSTSAGRRLSIGKNCTFQRLYAPEILIGQYPDEGERIREYEVPMGETLGQWEVKRNVKYVDKKMLDGKREAEFSICSKYDVIILENIILKGDLCSEKNARICDNAIVCGNIFAEGNIHIGKNSIVLGNVFSQESITLEENARVGQWGKIHSIVAREKIVFTDCAYVFGYISCEGGGIVKSTKSNKKMHDRKFWECEEEKKELNFSQLETYETAMKAGFRKNCNLQKVVIPKRAKEITKSMFFGCKLLSDVRLAETIEKIGAYAFADCRALTKLTSFENIKIKRIERAAFENCVGLEKLEFSKELEYLGEAAFAGCRSIRYVEFPDASELKVVSEHCFRDCRKLEWIVLPDLVEKVGISAFLGCDSLQYLSIPASCAQEAGIVELKDVKGLNMHIRGQINEGEK